MQLLSNAHITRGAFLTNPAVLQLFYYRSPALQQLPISISTHKLVANKSNSAVQLAWSRQVYVNGCN